jgi:Spy/CpxP family protein refolding chaperone
MICLALGLGVLGLVAARRARCHHHGSGGHHYGPPWARWHDRHHGRGMLYMMFARIDATPTQERAILHEVDTLRAKLRDSRATLRDSRGDLAAAMRGSSLDDAALGAVLGCVDAVTTETRGAVLEALRNIHTVLDDHQREKLASMLDGGWFKRGGSPYRM